MKLINCRIDAFGKLKGVQFEFGDGLNTFCFENGWGKTTLAAFIRAMFYGLRSERANAKDTGERAKYRPFGGGAFGGSLKFEHGGDIYTVQRTFDESRESRDRVEVYLNGRPAPELREDLGKSIFGIDEQSYLRTVFAESGDFETGSTGDINARLSDFTQGGISAEDAVKILDSERKRYKKDRGNGGLISAQSAACERIRADIYAAEQQKSRLDGLYAERAELAGRAAALQRDLKKTGDIENARARKNAYDKYSTDAARERAAAESISAKYPRGLPDRAQLERARQAIADIRAAERAAASPSAAQMAKRLEELENRFKKLPSPDDIAELSRAVEELKAGETGATDRKKKPKAFAPLIIFALVMFIGGITCAFARLMAVAIGLIVAGVALVCAALFVYVNSRFSALGSSSPQRQRLSAKVSAYLASYGYADGAYDFDSFMRDLDEFRSLKEDKTQSNGLKSDKLGGTYAAMNAFFAQYAPQADGTYEEKLRCISDDVVAAEGHIKMSEDLKRRAAEYADSKDYSSDVKGTEELVKQLSRLNSAVSSTEDRIEECEAYAEKLPDLHAALGEATQKLEEYEKTHFIITAAIAHINGADKTLKERLTSPVEEAYRRYAARVNAAMGKGATIEPDLSVKYEEGGALRGEEHMSTGQAAASALCFRLALCDCIYAKTSPFIVLDDPFAYLDEEHLANCKRVLYELSRDRQIIYFTCHPSRRI